MLLHTGTQLDHEDRVRALWWTLTINTHTQAILPHVLVTAAPVSQHTFAPNSREVNRDTVLKRNKPSMAGVTVYLSPHFWDPCALAYL